MTTKINTDYSVELEKNGFAIIPGLIKKQHLDSFEKEFNEVGAYHLNRKGVKLNSNDALAQLFVHSSEFRKTLFPQLKHLSSVEAIALAIKEKLHSLDFCSKMGMRFPVNNWSIKADIPGENKFLLPLHQDYKTPCHLAYRVWVPIHDASISNGTIKLLPGSHSAGYVEHDTINPELPTIPVDVYDESKVEILNINAGDGFLFHPLLFHASVAAKENIVKYVVMVNFWDLATLADPDDENDPIMKRLAFAAERDKIRDA